MELFILLHLRLCDFEPQALAGEVGPRQPQPRGRPSFRLSCVRSIPAWPGLQKPSQTWARSWGGGKLGVDSGGELCGA